MLPSSSDHFSTDFPQLDDPSFWAQVASQTDVPPDLRPDGPMPALDWTTEESQISLPDHAGSRLPVPLSFPYAQGTPELDDPTFWRQIASQVDVVSLLYPEVEALSDYPHHQRTSEHLMLPAPHVTPLPPISPDTEETSSSSQAKGSAGQRTQATEPSMLLPIIMIVLSAMIILTVFSRVGNNHNNTTNTFNDTTPEVSGTWNIHCQKVRSSSTGSTYSITGPSTIGADFINTVLDHYHSPMAGEGQLFENVSQYCSLDPAFVLAFYMHESSFGLSGEARESLSPGNLRCIPGVKCQDGYAWFESWQDGLMVQCRLLKNLYVDTWGLTTPEQIIPKYAPRADNNNEAGYEYALEHAVDTWRHHIVVVS